MSGFCDLPITEHVIVRVGSAPTDLRWPRFAEGVAELGVGSILAIPLSPRSVNAALSLYASAEEAFDAEDEFIGRAFATHAGIALAHAELEANLRTALRSQNASDRLSAFSWNGIELPPARPSTFWFMPRKVRIARDVTWRGGWSQRAKIRTAS
jgi:GAF domain-containing protein